MAKANEKLASSLKVLKQVQEEKSLVAIKSTDLHQLHRERLVKNGFLKNVAKGWYIVSNPTEFGGDSTSWYTSFWDFCARYLQEKFNGKYYISASQSLQIHAGSYTVPKQLVVHSPKASNKSIDLIHGTSILEIKSKELPNEMIEVNNGINILNIYQSLIKIPETLYKISPMDVRIGLGVITNSSDLLKELVRGSHSVIGGRIAGAFRNNGQERIADEIIKTMKSADFNIVEVDPFETKSKVNLVLRDKSPYANRIRLMWAEYRGVVEKHFPEQIMKSITVDAVIKSIDEIYKTDAYHSLSIERYVVSEDLIERVKSGEWDTEIHTQDLDYKNAMAARGYYLAMQEVKKSIVKILQGENSGEVLDVDHHNWYSELFDPSVKSGIIESSDLIGYRDRPVYITNSLHVPLNKEAVRDAMPVLMELLQNEENAGVRAVLGHFIFVFIHPYIDGNGRMARFLMNTMLVSGGYPWTVIPVEKRDQYMKALELASVENNIVPFVSFIAKLVSNSMGGNPDAKL